MNLKMLLLAGVLGLTACAVTTPRPTTSRDALPTDERVRRADAAYEQQNWPEAENYYQLLTSSDASAETWFRLGNVYAWTNRVAQALAAYREALEREPGNVKVLHNLGILYLRQADASFTEIRQHLGADDPLYRRSVEISSGIESLIEGD